MLCENAVGFSDVSLAPDVVLGLLAELDVSNNVGRALSETLESVCESRDALARVVEQMKIETEALRKDAELHAQIQRAARELPACWELRVCVEHESGYVELWDPDGCVVDFPNSCETLGLTVSDAIDAALSQEEQS